MYTYAYVYVCVCNQQHEVHEQRHGGGVRPLAWKNGIQYKEGVFFCHVLRMPCSIFDIHLCFVILNYARTYCTCEESLSLSLSLSRARSLSLCPPLCSPSVSVSLSLTLFLPASVSLSLCLFLIHKARGRGHRRQTKDTASQCSANEIMITYHPGTLFSFCVALRCCVAMSKSHWESEGGRGKPKK